MYSFNSNEEKQPIKYEPPLNDTIFPNYGNCDFMRPNTSKRAILEPLEQINLRWGNIDRGLPINQYSGNFKSTLIENNLYPKSYQTTENILKSNKPIKPLFEFKSTNQLKKLKLPN